MSNRTLSSLLWGLFLHMPRAAQVVTVLMAIVGAVIWWQAGSLPVPFRIETITAQVNQCGFGKLGRELGMLSLPGDASLGKYEHETRVQFQQCMHQVDLDVSPQELKQMLGHQVR